MRRTGTVGEWPLRVPRRVSLDPSVDDDSFQRKLKLYVITTSGVNLHTDEKIFKTNIDKFSLPARPFLRDKDDENGSNYLREYLHAALWLITDLRYKHALDVRQLRDYAQPEARTAAFGFADLQQH